MGRVLVRRPGLGLFNVGQLSAMLKIGDVASLLDENGWSIVHEQGATKDMVINVKAFPLTYQRTRNRTTFGMGLRCENV